MATLDLLYVALIAVALLLDCFVLWPTFLRQSQVEPARARLRIWSGWMAMLWTLVAAGVALWRLKDRDWGSLGLIVASGWRLWGAVGLVLALAIMYARTVAKVASLPPSRRTGMRGQFGKLAVMLPHTRSEICWFMALSVTAGFCEEFIFRGYLIWAFKPALGLWGAAAFSVTVFALAHAYQGVNGILKTGIMGGLLTLVVFAFGSLLPAIALHALVDVGSGLVAWLVLRAVPLEDDMVAQVAESA